MAARILVVEDDEDNRTFLCELLESWGYDCEAADTGEEALKHVDAGCPDAIISDLSMPGMTGLELLVAIRQRECARPLFVLLTGHATVSVAVQAIEHGADECLVKPMNIHKLHEMLERHGLFGTKETQ